MRVHELAKKLGIESSEVLERAQKLKFDVSTASSGLSDEEAARLEKELGGSKKKSSSKSAGSAKKSSSKKSTAKTSKKKSASKTSAAKDTASGKPASPKPRTKKPVSPFSVGDKVVYPHHGAATITKKEKGRFQEKRADYFVLELATEQLVLRVPVEKAEELGVRPVISKTAARRVLSSFKDDPEEAGANWSRWYKLLTEKINSGDIFQVAEVVRDLTYAQQTKGISPALKRMLSKARLILSSELRFALDLSEEDAMKRMDRALPKVEVEEGA